MPACPSLEIFALFMLTGIFSTLLIPETKGRSLEELSNEDQEGFVRGMIFSPCAENVTHHFFFFSLIGVNEVRVNKEGLIVQE